jgi:argininosuccinate lyase
MSGVAYTGRLRHDLSPTALDCIRPTGEDGETRRDSFYRLSEIDRAHVIMLTKACLIDSRCAAAILTYIARCRRENFDVLIDAPAPRGLYLLWEANLVAALGRDVAGSIHLARSRNDINATDARMRLRGPSRRLMRAVFRLATILLVRARRSCGVTMPIYTHFQAAQPISYGHYLAGILQPLLRSANKLLECIREASERCPLGAGAIGGTSIPIDTLLTADLLGFSKPVRNSIDAVSSRDFVLRLLGEITILGTLLSRLATDLQLWTTTEFAFLSLPDALVGSSSMMPQKRNPYLLEHIQGQSARLQGWLVGATTAMHAKPFSNNISANYEATLGLWDALETCRQSVTLARLVLQGATPHPAAMLSRAADSVVEATELAHRLVQKGHSFRSSHELVGAAITNAIEAADLPLGQAVRVRLGAVEPNLRVDNLDPASVMRASSFGGGPGGADNQTSFDEEIASIRKLATAWNDLTLQWENGARRLEHETNVLQAAGDRIQAPSALQSYS